MKRPKHLLHNMLRTHKRAGPIAALIAALAILPLALAACGGGGGSSDGASSGAKALKLWHYEGAD